MKSSSIYALALSAACASLSAQSSTAAAPHTLRNDAVASSCPVDMRARHSFSIQRDDVSDRRTPDGKEVLRPHGMELRLTLRGENGKTIQSASVTVTGISNQGAARKLWKPEQGSGARKLERALQIRFTPGDDDSVDSYFTAQGFGSITAIRLNHVTYADGSTWDVGNSQSCSVAPDPLMLIANR